MFHTTRVRLATLNAIVFFVILSCLSLILYTQLKNQLYAKVDYTLKERVHGYDQKPEQNRFLFYSSKESVPQSGSLKTTLEAKVRVQAIDPRIFTVLWDDKGNSIPMLPKADIGIEAINRFGDFRLSAEPLTVKIGDHVYRSYSASYNEPLDFNQLDVLGLPLIMKPGLVAGGNSTPITTVQAIINVDSEQNMLNHLLKLIVFGVILGGVATVAAGFYLANKALLPIRRAWDKQKQFVADASHELRTPLSIIHANAEHVFRHPDRTIMEMSEPIAMVLHESKRMTKLTDQLLTLARTDSDQEELMIKPLPLDEVIEGIVRKFIPLAETKHIRLEAEPAPNLIVQGDSERLQQLLIILLDNSLKYTSEYGSIRVSSCRIGSYVAIVVKDTGIGISAEDLPLIFDRFYRIDKSRNRSDGSTGLGLAIARWIVEQHGGTIIAESRLGEGTTMTIQLPV
jgi:two-component system, OmpR family, sensor histidine kinase CiaH